MADPGDLDFTPPEGSTWFADLLSDGSNLQDQMQAVKTYAYRAFDRIDNDKNGFLSHRELEAALASEELHPRERMFLTFLRDNQEQIADAFDECTIADGISRKDLEAYFDLLATLL